MIPWLLDTLLYTGLLIALVLLVRRPVARHFGPTCAYALWALPGLRLVMPPVILPSSMAPAQPEIGEGALLALAMATEASPAPAAVDAPMWWDRAELLLALWLGGALLFLASRMANYLKMRRELLREARPVGEVGAIRLVEAPAADSPIAFGVFDKVVALPPQFMAMEDRAARDLAIAHELAHHRGHDLLANFAAQPLLALHWFNPLAWFGWRAMRRDQEAACDARVIAGRGREERIVYAKVIASFAAGPRLALAAPMACPILGEKSIIHRLRSLSMSDVSPVRRRLGRALLAGGAIALPLTASISYAEERSIEEIPLPPSSVAAASPDALAAHEPEAALAPAYADAGHEARAMTAALQASEREAMPNVQSVRSRQREHLTAEQRRKLEEMQRNFEWNAAEWESFGVEMEKFGAEMERWGEAFGEEQARRFAAMEREMPTVVESCDGSGRVARSWIDAAGRPRIAVCEQAAERQAQRSALTGLRSARSAIAHNRAMSDAVRTEVLEDLDEEIARLEAES